MEISKNGPMTPERGSCHPTAGVMVDSAGSDPFQDAPATGLERDAPVTGETDFSNGCSQVVHTCSQFVDHLLIVLFILKSCDMEFLLAIRP
jgi:hypothetical protein